MPTDHLVAISPQRLAAIVGAVLAGGDHDATAAAADIKPADLADAVELYRAAGLAALEQHTEGAWYDVRIQFPDYEAAETTAAKMLGPRLDRLESRDSVTGWWFLRKHPCWRLRLHDADTTAVNQVLDELTASGVLARWWPAVYEPEVAAFGGPTAMRIVHDLFCADSRGVLHYARQDTPGLGRRELSILLINALLTAAGLDCFERGDVFDRVARMRPEPLKADTERFAGLAAQLRTLLAGRVEADNVLVRHGGPVAFAVPWLAACTTAGNRLTDAAAAGHLGRGLRAVLAHVVIFHWNRFGLSATTQGIIARAAASVLLPE